MVFCNGCGEPTSADDLCPDGACRVCHRGLSFEECCDGSWVARQRGRAGLRIDDDVALDVLERLHLPGCKSPSNLAEVTDFLAWTCAAGCPMNGPGAKP